MPNNQDNQQFLPLAYSTDLERLIDALKHDLRNSNYFHDLKNNRIISLGHAKQSVKYLIDTQPESVGSRTEDPEFMTSDQIRYAQNIRKLIDRNGLNQHLKLDIENYPFFSSLGPDTQLRVFVISIISLLKDIYNEEFNSLSEEIDPIIKKVLVNHNRQTKKKSAFENYSTEPNLWNQSYFSIATKPVTALLSCAPFILSSYAIGNILWEKYSGYRDKLSSSDQIYNDSLCALGAATLILLYSEFSKAVSNAQLAVSKYGQKNCTKQKNTITSNSLLLLKYAPGAIGTLYSTKKVINQFGDNYGKEFINQINDELLNNIVIFSSISAGTIGCVNLLGPKVLENVNYLNPWSNGLYEERLLNRALASIERYNPGSTNPQDQENNKSFTDEPKTSQKSNESSPKTTREGEDIEISIDQAPDPRQGNKIPSNTFSSRRSQKVEATNLQNQNSKGGQNV